MSAHNMLQQLGLESAPYRPKDPGAGGTLRVDRQFSLWEIETSTAEARTLAQPYTSHLYTTVELASDGGDLTLTVTGGWNAAGLTTITLNDVGDWVRLVSVRQGSSYYWRVDAAGGAPVPNFQMLGAVQTIDMADAQVALTLDGATGTQLTSNMLDVDANSAGTEDLLLPAEADCEGMVLFIKNTGGEDIVVKEDSDTTTIVTISTTEVGVVWCNGTAWTGGVMANT